MNPDTEICQYCHQAILPQYFFCPNCGSKVHEAPLSTSVVTQIGVYAFSIILPMICFIAVTKWPGQKYFKSEDTKTKNIGTAAWVILVLSTVITYWWAYTWTVNTVNSALNAASIDLSSYSAQ